jgi:NAD(P)H-dependent flavin oxidoreductase YrpB (nitropropane dioxygenase family)
MAAKDYDVAYIYAGEGVGLVNRERPAAEVVRELGNGAEELLRRRWEELVEGR